MQTKKKYSIILSGIIAFSAFSASNITFANQPNSIWSKLGLDKIPQKQVPKGVIQNCGMLMLNRYTGSIMLAISLFAIGKGLYLKKDRTMWKEIIPGVGFMAIGAILVCATLKTGVENLLLSMK